MHETRIIRTGTTSIPGADSGHHDAGAAPRRIGRLSLAAAGAAVAFAVIGGVAAAPLPAAASAQAASTPHASPATWCGVDLLVLRHDYDRLPSAMRSDIAAAHKQSSASAKKDALAKVLSKAQSGGYGAAIQAAAKDKKKLDGVVDAWDRLPSSLSSDLKKAKAASGSSRASDLEAILTKAESGGYGDRVKDVSDKLKTRLDRCVTRLNGSKSSGTGSSSSPSPSSPAAAPSTSTPTGTPSSTATSGA
ncbi:hypothetical protein HII28_03695 [Planctomonas sp. JC2975]|uniref:hypothetical protein n=1 Tax=Planctomonas sp. JC2975 TaxID=2729626 RepID=UPI001474E835|nr:hypothetical protein [Planctomonas sp. JC2975]NNC10983.1 hypothetical protein [Planctomonas sp. JC2975]